jgi:hypothetical protein
VAAAAHTRGCVLSDDPTALAAMNVLSHDLSDPRCVVWPDVTGWTYDRDLVKAGGTAISRPSNDVWQDDAVRYLEAGRAVLLARHDTGLGRESRRIIERGRVIARSGPFVLRTTG